MFWPEKQHWENLVGKRWTHRWSDGRIAVAIVIARLGEGKDGRTDGCAVVAFAIAWLSGRLGGRMGGRMDSGGI